MSADKINDGGPAFPVLPPLGPDGTSAVGYPYVASGLSVRDYFAAKAMPQVLVQCASDTRNPGESIEDYFARRAYLLADAMLRAKDAA
jgi:hypothetical protein